MLTLDEVESFRGSLVELWAAHARGINHLRATLEAWDEMGGDDAEKRRCVAEALAALNYPRGLELFQDDELSMAVECDAPPYGARPT